MGLEEREWLQGGEWKQNYSRCFFLTQVPFVISMSFSFLPSLEGHSNSFQQYLICILELFVPMAISNISVLPISTL